MDKLWLLVVVLKIKQLSVGFIVSDAIIIAVVVVVAGALYFCLLELILALTSTIL
jgi:hypothetical protein